MKWLVRSILPLAPLRLSAPLSLTALLALFAMSCTTTTNTTSVVSSLQPTITGFSPDTVWTFASLKISGSDFGYDATDIRVYLDTIQLFISSIDDTVLTAIIPETAHTGLIRIRSYEQTVTSAKPVVVNYTFSPHTIYDSVPMGGSFSIPGTGMNNARGAIRITLNGISLPVDSVFADRVVSHVIPNSWSGPLSISDSVGAHSAGALTVVRPTVWRTLSLIWDNLRISEYHSRVGYVNGPGHPIDSTWYTTATYMGQVDTSIAGGVFAISTTPWLVYSIDRANNGNSPLLQLNWDTLNQRAQVSFQRCSSNPLATTSLPDTEWYDNYEYVSAILPVDRDVEFTMPAMRYQIVRDSTDSQGLVNWKETTTSSIMSGSFDIILKQ